MRKACVLDDVDRQSRRRQVATDSLRGEACVLRRSVRGLAREVDDEDGSAWLERRGQLFREVGAVVDVVPDVDDEDLVEAGRRKLRIVVRAEESLHVREVL